MGNALGRDEPPPGDVAGVARPLISEQVRAHRRMDPIRADQNVPVNGGAIRERDGDAVTILVEVSELGVEVDTVGSEAAEEDVEQIGTMGSVVGCAEVRFRHLAERCRVEMLGGVPGVVGTRLRVDRNPR